jgi:hypothetical protein
MFTQNRQATRNLKKKWSNSREYLVLGCGHSRGCGLNHSRESFITVDISSKNNPDHIGNAYNEKTITNIRKRNHDKKFSAIIYEYLPFDAINYNLQSELKEDGCQIFMGVHVFDLIKNMPVGQQISIFMAPCYSSRASIVPRPYFDYNSHPALKRYLNSSVASHTKYDFLLTDKIKRRAACLQATLKTVTANMKFKLNRSDIAREDTLLSIILQEGKQEDKNVNKMEITKILNNYRPGFFRRNFSCGGKTKGIKQVKEFLLTCSDILSQENIYHIFSLIEDRNYRAYRSWNFTRNANGSTSRVHQEIVSLIMNKLMVQQEQNRDQNQSRCNYT